SPASTSFSTVSPRLAWPGKRGNDTAHEALLRRLCRREDRLPVLLYVGDRPALAFGFVHQGLRKGSDFGVGQPVRRAVGVFALWVGVQDETHEAHAVAGRGPFKHLLVAV